MGTWRRRRVLGSGMVVLKQLDAAARRGAAPGAWRAGTRLILALRARGLHQHVRLVSAAKARPGGQALGLRRACLVWGCCVHACVGLLVVCGSLDACAR